MVTATTFLLSLAALYILSATSSRGFLFRFSLFYFGSFGIGRSGVPVIRVRFHYYDNDLNDSPLLVNGDAQ
jgi:hypothetical protein